MIRTDSKFRATRLAKILLVFLFAAPPLMAEPGQIGTDRSFENRLQWQQQQEPTDYRDFSKRFVTFFNAKDRRPWTPLMSEKIDNPGKLVSFIKYIHQTNGDIRQLSFKYFDRRKQRQNAEWLAVYLAEFANGVLMEFRFGIDAEKRLRRMIYTDPNYNEALPVLASQSSLRLPFEAGTDWYVLWGGLTEDMNYHVTQQSQRNALDLLIMNPDKQSHFRSEGKNNEDYYAYGQKVVSPVDGIVVDLIDGVADNTPGEMNREQLTGNTIIIKTPEGEYLLLGHLQPGSIKVTRGQSVRSGHDLARVGNSGNSSEPHLHMQLMNAADMQQAIGIRMRFDHLFLNHESRVWNYAPIRTNIISYPAGPGQP